MREAAARAATTLAVLAEPVKYRQRTARFSYSSSAISAAPPGAWVTTFTVPGGKPASCRTSPISSPAVTGASSEGLTTTVLPAASGATTARHARTCAPFHGVKLATTPSGLRSAVAKVCGKSVRSISPCG
ncbi:hypothetical protein GCM10020295_78880 [Streptomyces cinereospinus]